MYGLMVENVVQSKGKATLSLQEHTRSIKSKFCALQGTKFISFRLCDLNHEDFRDLQGRRLRRTGRTPIEDNAANRENIMD